MCFEHLGCYTLVKLQHLEGKKPTNNSKQHQCNYVLYAIFWCLSYRSIVGNIYSKLFFNFQLPREL